MPTQEERLAAVETTMAASQQFQDQAIRHLRELDASTTILLGVIQSQGKDIRLIFDELRDIKTELSEHGGLLNEHTSLLKQILARLPEPGQQ